MLDYTFAEEQEIWRESVKEFCERKIAPRIEEVVEKERIPGDLVEDMAEFGLLAMTVSPEYGGSGADAVTTGIAAQELARCDPSCSIPVLFLVESAWAHLLDKYGTQQAKKEILPQVTKGEIFCGIATTESEVGSDLANMRTRIRKEGSRYIVSGEKNYISGVREAVEWGGGHVTLARQTPEQGTRGMTCFFLPLTAKGVTPSFFKDIGREGISCGGFKIDDVEIPEHYLIGEENKGFYIIHEGYELARGLIGLVCVGAAEKALENGMSYTKQRSAFGKPLAKYEGIQFPLAEHYAKMQALKELTYKALWIYDREREGKATRFEVSKAIAMVKMIASKWSFDAINDAMNWQGAFGYSKECSEQMALRGIRSFNQAEGSIEIMKIIVARELLGAEYIPYR
jgi:acyl-CoA dehydrogenase